jgi:rfaE bifunctional protein kinase chain/domain
MDFKDFFDQFNGKRILVIGDVMVDAYIKGKVTRISPEAPVPIVQLEAREDRLGGAANVALNLSALGASPILCSVIGNDKEAAMLTFLLNENGISAEGIIESSDRKTTVKTRVIGNHQQLLRIDSEQINAITTEESKALIDRVREICTQGIDAIIFEDYNKGVLTPSVIESIVNISQEFDIPTTVDPKKDNFLAFKNVTLFKPNLKELKEGLGRDFNFSNDKLAFETAVGELESFLNNTISMVTLSEHGVFIKDNENQAYFPAHLRTISDVSGAGDTVISVATLCLLVGMSNEMIAQVSNIAGGLVCEKSGVVPIDKQLLLEETIKLLGE